MASEPQGTFAGIPREELPEIALIVLLGLVTGLAALRIATQLPSRATLPYNLNAVRWWLMALLLGILPVATISANKTKVRAMCVLLFAAGFAGTIGLVVAGTPSHLQLDLYEAVLLALLSFLTSYFVVKSYPNLRGYVFGAVASLIFGLYLYVAVRMYIAFQNTANAEFILSGILATVLFLLVMQALRVETRTGRRDGVV